MAKLKITQVKSVIGRRPNQRRTIQALGLGRIRKSVIHEDTPQIRGMVRVVEFMIEVEEVK